MTCLVVLYTHSLLVAGGVLGGVAKFAVTLVLYLLVAVGIGVSFIFLLGFSSDPAVRQTGGYIVAVLAAWALVATPGILYLRKHMPKLRFMGFFQPR